MDKMKKYLLMLAVLLAATTSFIACSSDEDLVAEEGSQEEQGVVKTEFTISFPRQISGITRQSTEIVQGQTSPEFRGLQNIELRPFILPVADINHNTSIPTVISLGTPEGNLGYTLANDALIATNNSHIYRDIEIAIGTRSFMFYGLARNASVTSGSANIPNGALTKTETGTTLDGISFSLVPIVGNMSVDAEATEIANYLTNVANATYGTETTLTFFPNLTLVKTGSWNSVKAVVQQIYSVVYNKATYDNEGKATNLYGAIVKAILKQGESIFATEGTGENAGKLIFTGTGITKSFTYPQNKNLPDGAVCISWDSNKFNALAYTADDGMNITTVDKYVYPASLWYYGLSGIRTANVSMESNYNSTNNWATILQKYEAAEGYSNVVQSTTRSIAIEKEVQYGVGRLDVTVRSKNGSQTLEENVIIGTNSNNEPIYRTITFDSDDFPITGIIVGNQRAVDYEFVTKKSEDQYTIYDSQVYGLGNNTPNCYLTPASAIPENKTHTLVLQTPVASALEDADANVKIAVEFMNNSGQTIVGKDNQIIYPNTKFYLVGTLKPFANEFNKFKGTNDPIKQAFVQDYVTTANFVVQSFRSAYNLLPDLRSPKLEIGMSVDLKWEAGITQEIVVE